MPSVPLIEARAVVKRFGSLIANDHVDLDVAAGEIHALLGENGAGKSTLVKMLYGLMQPNEGTIAWQGKPVILANPRAARALGIGMVFQHFSLFENLTVAENIALALDTAPSHDRIAEVSHTYGLPLEPRRQVWTLSVGERQRVEIIRCLLQDPKLLILDEPTSVLTPQEADGLFVTLETLKAEGRSVLYISHKLDEVKRLCDRATILRHGKRIATCDPKRESAASMARMMVGDDVAAIRLVEHEASGPVRLALVDVHHASEDPHGTSLKGVSLEVRAGEILGIAGVAGNGQDELFAILSGERLCNRAENVAIDGVPVGHETINARRKRGTAFVPEERLGHAAAPRFKLSVNALVSGHATNDFVQRGFVDRGKTLDWVDQVTKRFDVRKGARDPEAKALSGGNLQKFVVGREILRNPSILVVAQPTWGVDAGAAALIRQALVDLARRGSAVLVISQDLDELLEISDRVAVMYHGTLSLPQPVGGLSRETIGLMMAGARKEAVA